MALGIQESITLCETHYQYVYRQVHAHKPCAGCGANPKARQGAFTRHSPDAARISRYLNDRICTGFDISITQADILCKSCYDMHLAIFQNIERQAIHDIPNLDLCISSWVTQLEDENTNQLTKAILATVVFIAKKFQQSRALLLPQAVTVFLSKYPHADEEVHLEMADGTIKFSARWLLNQLITYLEPYMSYKCVVKSLGTLLYPSNGDLLKCLSLALHDSSKICDTGDDEDTVLQLPTRQANPTSLLLQVGNMVNDAVHNEIRKHCSTDLTTFNLMKDILVGVF